MSKKYTTNFLEDTNGSTGSANQVLVSTAAGIDWVDGSGSGIIGGPYLPLAGGTLTGNTNLTGSTKKLILNSGAQLGFEDATPTGTIYLYNDGAATSRLNIGGTMWVEEAGNVGIGTTSPGYKLQVGDTGAGDGNIAMKANGSGADAGAKLTFNMDVGGGNTNSYIAQIVPISYDSLSSGTHNSLNFKVGTWNNNADAGVSRMTILSNGNVGIGTTDPGQKLAVQSSFANTASDSFVEINSGHEASGGSDITGEAGVLFKQAGSGNVLRSAGSIVSGREGNYSATSVADSYLAFSTAQNSVNAEKMRITSSGNVGIGTTSPDSILQVGDPMETNTLTIAGLYSAGGARLNFRSGHPSNSTVWNMGEIKVTDDGNYNGRIEFQTTASGGNVGASPTTKMVLKANGNVGIGTTNPAGTLSVENTGTAGVPVLDIINTSASMFNHSAEIMTPNMTTGQNNIFVIGRAGSTKNSGYIGYKYSGTAGANANVLTFGHWGSDNLMNIDGLGNVGIGTTSPEAKLNILSTGIDDEALVVQDNGRKIKIGRDSIKVTDLSNAVANMYLQGDGSNVILPNAVSRLGIGTTNPGEKLEVLGNVKAETLIATDLTDGYVPYSKSGTLGLQDSKIYTQGAGIGVGTTTLAAGCHITSLSNISATGYRVSAMQTAPSSRGDTGTLGEIRITADYIYVCYATNSWRRVAIAQW